MIRTATSVTITAAMFALMSGASACSSDKLDGDDKGSSGAGQGGSGGSSAGGTSTLPTAGAGQGLCVGKERKCLDAATLLACNPNSGAEVTITCADEFAKDGLISKGCTDGVDGVGCSLDGFSDQACVDGTGPFAFCGGYTKDETLDVYIACFRDEKGVRSIISCFADFVDDTDPKKPIVDCGAAVDACLPGEGGAGGMGGAGPEAGAGGMGGVGPEAGAGGAGGAP